MVVGDLPREAELVVIGGGPGGYAAAFRGADLGMETVLVNEAAELGGECLHVGCIPSKALLGIAELIAEASHARAAGVEFGQPNIIPERLRAWTRASIERLAKGLGALARDRDVEVIQGRARFEDSRTLTIAGESPARIRFHHAVLATGSRPATLPGLDPEAPWVWDSRKALALEAVPPRLLVVGGGYIGLELGSIYSALGSEVTVVELTEGLMPGVDRDLVNVLARRLAGQFKAIHLRTKLIEARETGSGVEVVLQGEGVPSREEFDRVLVAVGRHPNSADLNLERTGVKLNPQGFVLVDPQRRTADSHIYAIGDVAGEPMLAHKAIAEGKVAAEAIAGHPAAFEPQAIPAVVFTDPEVAWCGLTEEGARAQGIEVRAVRMPWSASGRAVAMGRTDGLTKLIFDPASSRLLGVGIVGRNAGELIAEGTLAVEMAAVAEDLAGTIHTHPTLSETLGEAAELFLGRPTHLPRP